MADRHYQRADGSTVPSVSTVLAIAKSDYRSPVLDAAAERGTAVHALIAADLRDEDAPAPTDPDIASGLRAWLGWRFSRAVVPEAVAALGAGAVGVGMGGAVTRGARDA